MKNLILIVEDFLKKMIIIEDNIVKDILIERKKDEEIYGNFYQGKITNIIPETDSIFFNIGLDKKAFLNISNLKNKRKFNIGDKVLVQVKKNPRDNKGADLTLDYSIAGKNLVLLPNYQLFSSKKILISKEIKENKEIKRLKDIFYDLEDYGIIIRTSASQKNKNELLEEYEKLVLEWKKIKNLYEKSNKNSCIYSTNIFIKKIFNDYIDDNISEIIVNNEEFLNKMKKYIYENNFKNLENKIKKYSQEEDILDYYSINKEIKKALNTRVYLNSGAYIVIENTEALISIDVNMGGNINNIKLEKNILHTNIEAAFEISRQIRLRNLAGIIIIDFINMKRSIDRKLVLKVLEENLKKDIVKSKIVNCSSTELVQIIRERKGNTLDFYYKEICPYCDGTGTISSKDSIILDLLKEIKDISQEKDIKNIEILTDIDIIKEIKKNYLEYFEKILGIPYFNKKLIFLEVINEKMKSKKYEIKLYK